MSLSLFLPIIFLVFGPKSSKAFNFTVCSYFCTEQMEDIHFTPEYLNNLYPQDQTTYTINIYTVESEMTINLDNLNSNFEVSFVYNPNLVNVTLETNRTELSEYNPIPRLSASFISNLFIHNINEQNDKNLIVFTYLYVPSISPKDPSKPLFLITPNCNGFSFQSLHTDTIYIGSDSCYFSFNQYEFNFKTIIFSPFIVYSYFPKDKSRPYIANQYLRSSITNQNGAIITYGKKKITVENPDGNIFTFIADSPRVSVTNSVMINSTITVEDGLDPEDLIPPEIDSRYSDNSNVIKGNWPLIKKLKINGIFLPNGSFLLDYSRYPRISGTIILSTSCFQVTSFYQARFILTEKTTTLYFENSYISENISLSTENDFPTFFRMMGPTKRMDHYNPYIVTDSPNIIVYVKSQNIFNTDGPGTVMYNRIDNINLNFETPVNFEEGGTIINPFGADYHILYDRIAEIGRDYAETNPGDDWDTLSKTVDYYIEFAKNRINDIADAINDFDNRIEKPITIIPKSLSENGETKSTLFLIRNEFPFTSLYTKGLNKKSKAVCVEEGTFDMSKWTLKIGTNILQGYLGYNDGDEYDEGYLYFFPSFANTVLNAEFTLSEDKKCLEVEPKNVPKSSLEFFIYTTNETFIQILEKIDVISLLTPEDLDAYSKMKSLNSKNIVLFILNDLPSGKSINLNKIRRDSNIFTIGFKEEKFDELLDIVHQIDVLDSKYDYDFHIRLSQQLIRLTSEYTKFTPKVSITFSNVQTFFIGCIDYTGTKIKSTNFYAFFSCFSNIKTLKNGYNVQTTLVESNTFELMKEFRLVDVVIIFVSKEPLNILTVKQIDFYENKWTFTLTGFLSYEGFIIDQPITISIEASQIRGQLIVYSFEPETYFNVPDQTLNQVFKGLVFNNGFLSDLNVKGIPGIMTLEDNFHSSIFSKFKSIFAHLRQKSYDDEDEGEGEETTKITFTGNWDKVDMIDGIILIDAGAQSAIIDEIPSVVTPVLEVRSKGSIQLNARGEVMNFTETQVVSDTKTISFPRENIKVFFSNISFEGDNPSLSLLINGHSSPIITDHIVVDEDSSAHVSGDIEIKKSIEIGPAASITAGNIKTENPAVIMKYRLKSNFGTIDDTIDPSSIVVEYIGESRNVDEVTDYSMYVGNPNTIKRFTASDHVEKCKKWKDMTKIESSNYPEFRQKEGIVEVICIDEDEESRLGLRIKSIPNGDIQPPPDDPVDIFPTGDVDEETPPAEDDDNNNNGNEVVSSSSGSSSSSQGNVGGESGGGGGNEVVNPGVDTSSSSSSSSSSSGSQGNSGNESEGGEKKKKSSTGLIVGVVVAVIAVIAIVSVLVWYFVFYKRKKNQQSSRGEAKSDVLAGKEPIQEKTEEINDFYYEAGIVEDV